MQITIDTHTATPAEARALMRLLLGEAAPTVATGFDAQKCRDTYENTYHKVAADIPFDVWEFVWKSAHGVWAGGPVKYIAAITPSDMSTPEITALLADLNAELYSRRVIKPEDNPAAGVELPAAAVAGMDDTIKASDDLATIFGAAGTDPDALASHPEITNPPEPKITDMVITMLDKNGLPWDTRIHAASKAINADGTWRQKRGVAPELVATVETQLRGVMAVPVPDTHGSPELDEDAAKLEAMGGDAGPTMGDIFGVPREYLNDTQPAAPVVPPPPPVMVEARAAGAPPEWVGQSAPPPPPPVTTPPASDPTTFPELVQFVTAQKLAGKLTQAQLDAALQIIGVQGALPVMAARPDLIPTLVAKLRIAAGGA